ncbi:MAG TPA: hypothetical protein VN733_01025 [Solirubrobacterales bacterium]|nr:hypothetical protein [Solirubrobacterales bacterium]
MRPRLAAVMPLAFALLACSPAGAGAGGRDDADSSKKLIRIELEGSNDYSVSIVSSPRQRLTVLVAKDKVEETPAVATEYLVQDTLPSPDRVKAKLPGLGSISVSFRPRGRARHPSPPGCDGPLPTVQPGVVRGTIRFVGESDYTRVEAHRAEAVIEEPKGWRCRPGAELEVEGLRRRSEWTSNLSVDTIGAYFLARKYKPGVLQEGQVLFVAEAGIAFETAPGHVPLVVYRRVKVAAPASAFADQHPERIVVSPPPPFTGTATFFRTPESVFAWRGDLSVQYPGVDPEPLAGPDFEPDYCLREVGCIRQHVR